MRRIIIVLMAVFLIMGGRALGEASAESVFQIREINRYGNLVLDYPADEFLALGFSFGDVITATIGEIRVDMPVCAYYTDVDEAETLCHLDLYDDGTDNSVSLSIKNGSFVSVMGLAQREEIEEEPGYRWAFQEDYGIQTPVIISMKEKGGYLEEYRLRQMERSNDRADYPGLTDEQFANFRQVRTTGMAPDTLYRSSSPINPVMNRNREADEALERAGIQTIINLADAARNVKEYDHYRETHYARRNIFAREMPVQYDSELFMKYMAEAARFMIDHDGPYLIHCKAGRDRTGMVVAILECLMGATADEVIADYMESYVNIYGLKPGDGKYELIARSNIQTTLAQVFGIEDMTAPDAELMKCAARYLRHCGLTTPELLALTDRLAGRKTDQEKAATS